ncbi:MAG: hypothetical protein J6I68_15250 [Butyrivibrio sp.]|uniref:hypothetical protein n=1 Tax=Butyrivibrio sp. TaxID=28121 RepID=UPI001B56BC6C|nr:hypothetical protein [Butyrivibrio sp.]MBP3784601.1 hypothetical protein [Butyrivibrio sp.]
MRKINLKEIELNGEKLPYYCDLYVLSKVQDRMSAAQFERDLLGAAPIKNKDGEVERDESGRIKLVFKGYVIETMIFGLTLMINEGIAIKNDQEGTKIEEVDEKFVGRVIDMQPPELSALLIDEFNRCFAVKKNMTT